MDACVRSFARLLPARLQASALGACQPGNGPGATGAHPQTQCRLGRKAWPENSAFRKMPAVQAVPSQRRRPGDRAAPSPHAGVRRLQDMRALPAGQLPARQTAVKDPKHRMDRQSRVACTRGRQDPPPETPMAAGPDSSGFWQAPASTGQYRPIPASRGRQRPALALARTGARLCPQGDQHGHSFSGRHHRLPARARRRREALLASLRGPPAGHRRQPRCPVAAVFFPCRPVPAQALVQRSSRPGGAKALPRLRPLLRVPEDAAEGVPPVLLPFRPAQSARHPLSQDAQGAGNAASRTFAVKAARTGEPVPDAGQATTGAVRHPFSCPAWIVP